jgi:hypothetical protein
VNIEQMFGQTSVDLPSSVCRWKEVVSTPTSKKDASKAGKLLSNPKTPKTVKSVAGSDLSQRKPSGGKKK